MAQPNGQQPAFVFQAVEAAGDGLADDSSTGQDREVGGGEAV
jgi:hypothetical protein